MQINANSTLQFVGCVKLLLAERTFQLNRNVSRHSRMVSGHEDTPLHRMLTHVRLAESDDSDELSAEAFSQPLNCTDSTFDCAVTGARASFDLWDGPCLNCHTLCLFISPLNLFLFISVAWPA